MKLIEKIRLIVNDPVRMYHASYTSKEQAIKARVAQAKYVESIDELQNEFTIHSAFQSRRTNSSFGLGNTIPIGRIYCIKPVKTFRQITDIIKRINPKIGLDTDKLYFATEGYSRNANAFRTHQAGFDHFKENYKNLALQLNKRSHASHLKVYFGEEQTLEAIEADEYNFEKIQYSNGVLRPIRMKIPFDVQ